MATRPTFLELFAAVNAHTDAHGATATAQILAHLGGLDRFGLIDVESLPAGTWAKAIGALSGQITLANLEAETEARIAKQMAEATKSGVGWSPVSNGSPSFPIPHAGMQLKGKGVAGQVIVLPPSRR